MTQISSPKLVGTFDKITVLTKAELHQKIKSIKKEMKLKNPFYQSERVKVIKEKIEHYTKTGNQRKLDIYRRKLE